MLKKIGKVLFVLLLLIAVATTLLYSSFKNERLDMLESNSQIAQTAVGPIEYTLSSENGGENGPVMLVLHGTPGGYDQTMEVEGFRVLTPSRPGYLRTPLSVGSTPAEQASAYIALLDTLSIESVVVMGLSGGGPSSLAFAAMFPLRTNGLIALEAVSQPIALGLTEQSEQGEVDLQEIDQQTLEEAPWYMQLLFESDFANWAILSLMENLLGPEAIIGMLVPDSEIQQLILQDAEKTAAMTGLIWSIWPVSQRMEGQTNDGAQFSILDLPSGHVLAPTLIIHGTADANVPYSQSVALENQIPGSVLHTIEGADHMMIFSHEEEIDAVVGQFLDGLELN